MNLIAECIMFKEAESRRHAALTELLHQHAFRMGYKKVLKELPSGRKPDVIRLKEVRLGSKLCQFLFVGDAKVADHETAQNKESAKRILLYAIDIVKLIRREIIQGSVLSVITDSEKAAQDWDAFINRIMSFQYGCGFNTKIRKINSRYWIASIIIV